MKKTACFSIFTCMVLALSSCTANLTSVPETVTSPEEYDFSVQALSGPYLKRKIKHFVDNDFGTKLERQIAYGKEKQPGLLAEALEDDHGLYEQIVTNPKVSSRMDIDTTFREHVLAAEPPPPRRLAFVRDVDQSGDVIAINENGEEEANFGPGAAPQWSPDGSQLIFYGRFNGSSGDEVITGNRDGSDISSLTPADGGFQPFWSPTGSKIIFYSQRDGRTQVYSMDPDGTDQINLSNGTMDDIHPDVSPNESRVAFVSYVTGPGEQSNIYTVDANGNDKQQLTTESGLDFSPKWSPGGNKIAFASNRDGNFDVYTMNPDGSGLENISDDPGHDFNYYWSPDGGKIYFHSGRNGNGDIYSVNPDGSSLERLTDADGDDNDFQLSPDGTKIVFSSERDGNREIYVMNSDGSNEVNLTNTDSVQETMPAWSKDGKRISYNSDDNNGTYKIFVMKANGGKKVDLMTGNTSGFSAVSWTSGQ